MLVLSRRKGQSIIIGKEVKIYLVDIRGDAARMGVEAPREIPVVRTELVDKEAADADVKRILKSAKCRNRQRVKGLIGHPVTKNEITSALQAKIDIGGAGNDVVLLKEILSAFQTLQW